MREFMNAYPEWSIVIIVLVYMVVTYLMATQTEIGKSIAAYTEKRYDAFLLYAKTKYQFNRRNVLVKLLIFCVLLALAFIQIPYYLAVGIIIAIGNRFPWRM